MALRGFQSRPDSVRGLVTSRDGLTAPIQNEIVAPKLDAAHKKLFLRLVAENRAAGVAIRQIDADLYADLACCMNRAIDANDDLYLKLAKHINELRSALNMGPRNRQRAGIRDKEKPKADNPQLALIDRAKRNSIL